MLKKKEDEKIYLCIKEKAALFCLSLMLAFVVMFFYGKTDKHSMRKTKSLLYFKNGT